MKITAEMKLVDNETLFAVGDVVLDDFIRITGVKVLKLNEDYKVFLPRKKAGTGWNTVINVTDPEVLKEIQAKVCENVKEQVGKYVSDTHVEDLDVEIVLYHTEKLYAYANLFYKGIIKISNIHIKESNGELRVVWPYSIEGGKWKELVGIDNIFSRNEMEKYILKKFEETRSSKLNKSKLAERK